MLILANPASATAHNTTRWNGHTGRRVAPAASRAAGLIGAEPVVASWALLTTATRTSLKHPEEHHRTNNPDYAQYNIIHIRTSKPLWALSTVLHLKTQHKEGMRPPFRGDGAGRRAGGGAEHGMAGCGLVRRGMGSK